MIAETSCTSKCISPFKTVSSEPHLSYLPVMINRLMLSLKKAITSREQIWSLGEPTINIPMKFPGHRGLVTIVDEIRLDEFSSRGEEAQSQA